MKKFILFFGYIVAILIVAELGITFYISNFTEKRFREMQVLLSDNQLISVDIVSFNKGLFSSEAITEIKLKALPGKTIKIKHTIFNGPIILGQHDKPIDFQMAVIHSTPGEMPNFVTMSFDTKTDFHYSGIIAMQTLGSAFNINQPIFQIMGTKWTSNTIISGDRTSIKGEMVFPDATLQVMGLPVLLKDVKMSFDQRRDLSGSWLGDVLLILGDIEQKENSIKISNLQFSENSALRKELIDASWTIKFEKFQAANDTYGPLNLKMQLKNIDPNALKTISLSQQGKVSDSQKLDEAYKALLLQRPTFLIENSHVTIPQGNVNLDLLLSVGGPNITMPLSQEILLNTVDGEFKVVVPKEILRQGLRVGIKQHVEKDPDYQKFDEIKKNQYLESQIDLKINKIREDQVLTDKDNAYEIKVNIEKGKWVVNGKEIKQPLS